MAKRQRTYSKNGLYFFTLLAHSQRSRQGAYVNCWINFRMYEGALVLAKYYVRNAGWSVRSVTDYRWLNGPSDVPKGSLRYFREAKADGASFVFHFYPRRRTGGHRRPAIEARRKQPKR